MPEQLTKHPEVTLQVLRSAGAQCGTGAPPTILKACPAERFCKLPGGDICVYGLADARSSRLATGRRLFRPFPPRAAPPGPGRHRREARAKPWPLACA